MVGFLLLVATLLVYARWVEPVQLAVRRVDVPIAGLPADLEGYTVLVASDLHSVWFGPGQERVATKLDLQAALAAPDRAFDAAVFTGDLIDVRRQETSAGAAFLKVLAGRAPTYFVPGNHDELRLDEVMEAAAEAGAHLPGRSAPGPVGMILDPSGRIAFVGADRWRPHSADLAAVTRQAAAAADVVIVLLHPPSPESVQAANQAGASLVIAGHDHGGQVALPLVGAIWTPTRGWFPGRAAGLFTGEDAPLFVSRGLGTSVLRIRLFAPPTLALLRLVPAPNGTD